MNDTTVKLEKRGKAGWIVTATAIGFLLILGYGLQSQFVSAVGSPAPDFTLSLFDGEELSLADQRGMVIVVNFWASWCPPCRDEGLAGI
jgi:thiol-disulfide isomerase/thioredoxin